MPLALISHNALPITLSPYHPITLVRCERADNRIQMGHWWGALFPTMQGRSEAEPAPLRASEGSAPALHRGDGADDGAESPPASPATTRDILPSRGVGRAAPSSRAARLFAEEAATPLRERPSPQPPPRGHPALCAGRGTFACVRASIVLPSPRARGDGLGMRGAPGRVGARNETALPPRTEKAPFRFPPAQRRCARSATGGGLGSDHAAPERDACRAACQGYECCRVGGDAGRHASTSVW